MAWTIPELEMLTQPRLLRPLARARASVQTVVGALHVEVATSPEPTAFEDRLRLRYRSATAGKLWGRAHVCAWFHVTADLRGLDGELALLLDTDGESVIRNDAGDVVGMVTSRLTPMERHAPSRAKTRVDLTPELLAAAAPDGRLSLWLDTGFNGKLVQPFGIARVRRLDLVRIDREREQAYYDLMAVAYASLRAGADTATYSAALDRGLDAYFSGDLAGVRSELAPVLDGEPDTSLSLRGLGHAHLDMAWLWPVRETRRKAHRTFRSALDLLDRYPDFRMGQSQPQQFSWLEKDDPALFARLRDAVAAGRFEIQGGFWVEPDTNLPSGESLVRQAVHGQRYWESRFGQRVDICWLPDAFGYTGALPQILRHAGMRRFLTIKLAWNEHNDFPHRSFVWEGIDGTPVLVHMPPEGTYTSTATGLAAGGARDQHPERDIAPIGMVLFGTGDGGGGPSEVHLEMAARSGNLLGLPSLQQQRAVDFFGELDEFADVLPHWRGELYLEKHQGTLTTQAHVKAGNRRLEHELHDLEYLAAVAVRSGRSQWPTEVLDRNWETLLLHQFHDMLPGSSIERVHRETRGAYEQMTAELGAETSALLESAGVSEDSAAQSPAFVNTTPVRRRGYLKHDGTWFHHDVAPFATEVMSAYPIGSSSALGFDDWRMWNDQVRVVFAPDGTITSLVDVATGQEHARGAINRLVIHRDPFQMFDAWDISPDYVTKRRRPLAPDSHETFIDGPRVVRRHTYRSGKTRITQDVVLTLGEPLVRFETDVDWQERLRMLRVEFEPEAWADEVACEIQFGHIMRSTRDDTPQERAQYEICAHRFVDVSDARGFGFSVLNDGKYGHRVKSRLISLNLLRSPVYPDLKADRGRHRFTYAVHPHAGPLGPSTAEWARGLNAPVLVAPVPAAPPTLVVSPETVLVDSVLIEPETGDLLLRVYESSGSEAVASVRLGPPFDAGRADAARFVTALLDDVGPCDLSAVPLRGFELLTIRVPRG